MKQHDEAPSSKLPVDYAEYSQQAAPPGCLSGVPACDVTRIPPQSTVEYERAFEPLLDSDEAAALLKLPPPPLPLLSLLFSLPSLPLFPLFLFLSSLES